MRFNKFFRVINLATLGREENPFKASSVYANKIYLMGYSKPNAHAVFAEGYRYLLVLLSENQNLLV